MKHITSLMVNEWGIKKLGLDFMGYTLEKGDIYTYHHIIKRENGGPMTLDNGAILCGSTSHPYLHAIENRDIKYYEYITEELLEINKQHEIRMANLYRINEILTDFEDKHIYDRTRKGRLIVKAKYLNRPLNKNY